MFFSWKARQHSAVLEGHTLDRGETMTEDKAIFSRETFRFFRDLEKNNRKEWMHENRDRYEAHIVAPFRRLLEALTPAVKKLNPAFDTGGRTPSQTSPGLTRRQGAWAGITKATGTQPRRENG